jgi:hypothetical protein
LQNIYIAGIIDKKGSALGLPRRRKNQAEKELRIIEHKNIYALDGNREQYLDNIMLETKANWFD